MNMSNARERETRYERQDKTRGDERETKWGLRLKLHCWESEGKGPPVYCLSNAAEYIRSGRANVSVQWSDCEGGRDVGMEGKVKYIIDVPSV